MTDQTPRTPCTVHGDNCRTEDWPAPGTTAPPVGTDLRDRIRRAICEANGFTWLPDELMEPDEYGEHADAVLSVLRRATQPEFKAVAFPAPADRAAAEQPADRRARYAAAIRAESSRVDDVALADAVMAVADTEQAALRAEVEGLDEALRGAISVSEEDGARLRAEVERLRTDRATVLREASDFVAELLKETPEYGLFVAEKLCRLADEAQQPETEAHPTEVTWIGEIEESDGLWGYLRADCDRAVVEKRTAQQQKRFPAWNDGTPIRTRLVRKTTTYTVVQPTPAPSEEPK
ncbi:hypothetical protein ACFYPA_06375 [Streptomyces sp. NPDC005775]|uniref:hypothetical protein n=1 Tax=Streptomyces sp. NPDC005775 TaxID=3364729 RepID=UPI0036B973B3